MGKEPIDYGPIDKALKQQALDKLNGRPYRVNRLIAEDHSVSVSSVEKRKKLLAKAQVMQEAADICRNDERGTKKRPKGTRGNASPFHDALQRAASSDDAEDFFQTYADHRILTPDESMRLMSGMACDPNIPPQVRTSAAKELDSLRVRHAPKETLGPGPPLTTADKFARVLAVLEACPPSVQEQAFATLSFPTPDEVDERIARESTGHTHTEYWGQIGPQGFTESVTAHGRLADQYRCLNCDEPKIADHDTKTFRHLTPEAAEHCANYEHPDWGDRIDRLSRIHHNPVPDPTQSFCTKCDSTIAYRSGTPYHLDGGSPSSPKEKP